MKKINKNIVGIFCIVLGLIIYISSSGLSLDYDNTLGLSGFGNGYVEVKVPEINMIRSWYLIEVYLMTNKGENVYEGKLGNDFFAFKNSIQFEMKSGKYNLVLNIVEKDKKTNESTLLKCKVEIKPDCISPVLLKISEITKQVESSDSSSKIIKCFDFKILPSKICLPFNKINKKTLEQLKESLGDKNDFTRRLYAVDICSKWEKYIDEQTIDILEDIALNDRHLELRKLAIKRLKKIKFSTEIDTSIKKKISSILTNIKNINNNRLIITDLDLMMYVNINNKPLLGDDDDLKTGYVEFFKVNNNEKFSDEMFLIYNIVDNEKILEGNIRFNGSWDRVAEIFRVEKLPGEYLYQIQLGNYVKEIKLQVQENKITIVELVPISKNSDEYFKKSTVNNNIERIEVVNNKIPTVVDYTKIEMLNSALKSKYYSESYYATFLSGELGAFVNEKMLNNLYFSNVYKSNNNFANLQLVYETIDKINKKTKDRAVKSLSKKMLYTIYPSFYERRIKIEDLLIKKRFYIKPELFYGCEFERIKVAEYVEYSAYGYAVGSGDVYMSGGSGFGGSLSFVYELPSKIDLSLTYGLQNSELNPPVRNASGKFFRSFLLLSGEMRERYSFHPVHFLKYGVGLGIYNPGDLSIDLGYNNFTFSYNPTIGIHFLLSFEDKVYKYFSWSVGCRLNLITYSLKGARINGIEVPTESITDSRFINLSGSGVDFVGTIRF